MLSATLTVSEPTIHCSVVTDPAQLEALRPAWLDLLERSPKCEVMLTPMWLLPWWQVFGRLDGRQLRIGLFYDGERLVGLAPLLARRHWYRPGLPFRRLEFLGTGEHASDRIWSDYLNVIVERGAEARVADSFAAALKAGAFGSWDELVLQALDGESALPELLVQAFRREGLRAHAAVYGEAPYIPLPASWDAYLKSLSSSRRYFIKRSIRDFEEWAGGDFQVIAANTPATLEEGRRHLVALHTERWQSIGGSGAFQSPRFNAFHDAAQGALLAEGALDLIWLRARGDVVAVLYNLRWNGKISVYQAGRRTDLPAAIRPGVVLHGYAIQKAIAAGLHEYDFLAGVSRYKKQFAPAVRPLLEVRVAPRSLVETTRRLVEGAVSGARALRNRVRWLTRPRPQPGTGPARPEDSA